MANAGTDSPLPRVRGALAESLPQRRQHVRRRARVAEFKTVATAYASARLTSIECLTQQGGDTSSRRQSRLLKWVRLLNLAERQAATRSARVSRFLHRPVRDR